MLFCRIAKGGNKNKRSAGDDIGSCPSDDKKTKENVDSINWDGESFEMYACKNAFDGSHACDYGLCGPCRDAKFLRPRGEDKTEWKRQTDLLDKAAMDRVKEHLGVRYGNACDN